MSHLAFDAKLHTIAAALAGASSSIDRPEDLARWDRRCGRCCRFRLWPAQTRSGRRRSHRGDTPRLWRAGLWVRANAKRPAVAQTVGVPKLIRDGIALAYEEAGRGAPALVFVHGLACHRGFWAEQVKHFSRHYRVLAVDLRGHGDSDAPEQRYTMQLLADDVAWMCSQLGIERPVVVGHSLGGLVGLELAAGHGQQVRAVTLVDSILLVPCVRAGFVRELVAALRSADASRALREYYSTFFGPHDDPARMAWILDEIIRTPAHVTSSILEDSVQSWDDADALARCEVPLLYLDASTPNADLARATKLQPQLAVGRTIGSGHFSPCEVPEQINAMLERFLAVGLEQKIDDHSAERRRCG